MAVHPVKQPAASPQKLAILAVGLETEAARSLNEAQQHMYSILTSVVSEPPRQALPQARRTKGGGSARDFVSENTDCCLWPFVTRDGRQHGQKYDKGGSGQ